VYARLDALWERVGVRGLLLVACFAPLTPPREDARRPSPTRGEGNGARGSRVAMLAGRLDLTRIGFRDQFRWTRQFSPTARSLEHSISADGRLSLSTRTRVQIAWSPPRMVVRRTTGSYPQSMA